jgi:hypothetical protein
VSVGGYDDGLPREALRVYQPWDHGPIFTGHRVPQYLDRAWCAQCRVWVGPDRTGDPHALQLVEDDACAHAHAHNTRCRVCEACRPDGALRAAVRR